MISRRRIAAWMAETHGGLFELTRHFLRDLLSTELISSREHLDRLIVAVLTALPGIGFVLPRVYFHKYGILRDASPDLYLAAVRADRLFFVTISMLITGLATILLWQSMFPSRRDYLVLRSLPVRLSHIFLARFASVMLVLGLLILDANLTLSFSFPLVSANGLTAWRYILAHAMASMGGGVFVLFAMLAVQGVLMNLLPVRWFEAVSVALQAVFLLLLLLAIPLTISLPNQHLTIAARPAWLAYLPSAWFLGLYEQVLGSGDGYFRWMATIAFRAMAVAVGISLLSYLISYRRYAARATVLVRGISLPNVGRLGSWFSEHLFPNSSQQAVAGFGAATLRRSRHHKLLLVVYIGVAAAIALDSAGSFSLVHRRLFFTRDHFLEVQAVLAVPVMVGMLVVYGLLHVFRVPSEPRANWIFRMTDHETATDYLSPVSKSVSAVALLPVLLVTPFATAYALGWRIALLHTAFAALLVLLVAEFKIADWDRIPFTCSYLAGKRPFFHVAAFATLWFVLLTTVVTGIEAGLLLHTSIAKYVALALLAAFYLWKSYVRRRAWTQTRVIFEELPEDFLRLGIVSE